MDADFEQHYQAAERAYGLGDYAEAHALTAMPWLTSDEEPRAMPTPEANSQAEVQKQEPEPTAEEPPPDPIEPAATKLLEHSWLRIQLQPDIKSPIDSVEPMGLINRIKGVIARSAGR